MQEGFNARCYALLQQVPKGKVTTYKDLAQTLNTRAWRAVGRAMASNPALLVIPCHRVVRSDGLVGEYALGKAQKIELLRSEGIEIENERIQNFNHVLYHFTD